MTEFIINTLTHPAFTAAIGFLAGHFLAIGRDRRKEYIAAANGFRNVVLTELKGIVPANGIWKPETYEIIKNTIPTIKQAALEFRPTTHCFRKSRFDKAVLEYCEQSENINWEQAILDAADETAPEKTQKGKFIKCVFHLLSFAE